MSAATLRPGFTLDELLAELARRPEPLQGYRTLVEWRAELGVSDERMHEILASAKRRGVLDATRDAREAIDGSYRRVPVYRFALGEGAT